MIKTKRTTSVYRIIAGLRIIIIAIAPEPGLCCTVTDICICVCVIQPERNVDTLNLTDMILRLKRFREKALTGKMLFQSLLRRFLVQLKRDHIIRLQRTGQLPGHHYRTSTKRAGRCCRIGISHDLTATGLAHIGTQTLTLSVLPLTAGLIRPAHILRLLFLHSLGIFR